MLLIADYNLDVSMKNVYITFCYVKKTIPLSSVQIFLPYNLEIACVRNISVNMYGMRQNKHPACFTAIWPTTILEWFVKWLNACLF